MANDKEGEPKDSLLNTRVPLELHERIRDACWWLRITIAGLARQALEEKLAQLERRNKGAFPKRKGELAKSKNKKKRKK